MSKQISILNIAILLLFSFVLFSSFVYSTKLIVIDNQSNIKSISKLKPNTLTHQFNNEVRLINDSDFANLPKTAKIRVLASIDNSSIVAYQMYSVPSINANYFWSKGYTGSGLKLGLVDSGISYSSDALNSKIFSAYDFTDDSNVECLLDHGCKVSSIMVGEPSLSYTEYKGVAYDAQIVSGKIFNASGYVPGNVDIVDVFDWVVSQGANYINNSWGSPKYIFGCLRSGSDADGNGNALVWDFYDYNLNQIGNPILLLFSAGNEGSCTANGYTLSDDASAYNVLTVGALDDGDTNDRSDDVYSLFSSQGPTDDNRKKPDLVAPGEDIISSNYDSWELWSGTSASSPHVTASAGLLSQLGLNPLEIKALLINSSDDIDTIGWDRYTGWGYVNLEKAYDENNFVNEYDFNFDNYSIDTNNYSLTINDTNSDFYYLDSNENAKCTIVWRREFDLDANPFVQNYDLYLHKDVNILLSNSTIDNVEQIDLTNDNSNSFVKVYCDSNCQDINYALACNLDYNKINLDYYPYLKDITSYVGNNDVNYILDFNFNTNSMNNIDSNLDYNFDMNIYNSTNSYLFEYNDVNYLQDFNLDLNSDFYPLSDYNIITTFDYYSYDYNQTRSGNILLYLNTIDVDTPTNADSNIYYQSTILKDYNFIFYDPNIYSVDYNIIDLNIYNISYDSNGTAIILNIDFNCEDYNAFGKHTIIFDANDTHANSLTKTVFIYCPYFALINSYIDYNNNLLYYKEDLNDLNFVFYYDSTKDFNLYLDSNEFSFSKDANLFYYDLNLINNSNIIIKDNSRDINVMSLQLILNPSPLFITESITKDFNVLIQDNDLNLDTLVVLCDSNPLSPITYQDNNNYYISGTCNSSVGIHTLDINVYDYVNNFSNQEYNYTISQTISSGGGGGASRKEVIDNNLDSNTSTIIIPKSSSDYNYTYVNNLSETGTIIYKDSNLYFFDLNGKLIIDANVKIYDSNKLIFVGNLSNVSLGSGYAGKTLTIIAYAGNSVLFKGNVFIPKQIQKMPNVDINNSKIVPFLDNNVQNPVIINNYNLKSILLYGVGLLVLIFIFCLSWYIKRKAVLKRYKYK